MISKWRDNDQPAGARKLDTIWLWLETGSGLEEDWNRNERGILSSNQDGKWDEDSSLRSGGLPELSRRVPRLLLGPCTGSGRIQQGTELSRTSRNYLEGVEPKPKSKPCAKRDQSECQRKYVESCSTTSNALKYKASAMIGKMQL